MNNKPSNELSVSKDKPLVVINPFEDWLASESDL